MSLPVNSSYPLDSTDPQTVPPLPTQHHPLGQHHCPGQHPPDSTSPGQPIPMDGTPWIAPPPSVQQVGGMHLTGMLSCLLFVSGLIYFIPRTRAFNSATNTKIGIWDWNTEFCSKIFCILPGFLIKSQSFMIFLRHEIFPDFPEVVGTLLIVVPCDNLCPSYSHDSTLYLQKKSYLICRDKIFITARKRSLWHGNIFTSVCHSVHGGGGGDPPGQRPSSLVR